jgi:hypothetical protein
MSENQKARFREMAAQDKARYESELQNANSGAKPEPRGKKRKAKRDPNAPKKCL